MRVPHLLRQAGAAHRAAWLRAPGLRRHRLPLAALLSAALASAIAVPALAGATSPAAHRAAPLPVSPATAPVLAAAPGAPRPLTLPTGERVLLRPVPGGRSVVSVTPPRGAGPAAGNFVDTFQIGGDVYAVPGYALPYLGSRLDPRLFDVSYLSRAGYAGRPVLPLTITWQHPAHPAIPGLATAATGRQTSGSLALASAARFGAALRAALRGAAGPGAAGHPAGTPFLPSGPLAQVKRISLAPLAGAGTATTGAAAPAVPLASASTAAGTPLYTLTVSPVGRNGAPAYALIAVQNLDNLDTYYSVTSVTAGTPLAVSVPAGHYAVDGLVFQLFEGALAENITFVPVPDLPVSHDTSISLDARQAQPVTVTVPNKVAAEVAGMTFTRTSARGGGLQDAMYTFGPAVSSVAPPVHLFATPTPAPATGSLGFADSWELQPPGSGLGGADVPYTYNLDFASSRGVPALLSHDLATSDLATVQDNFASSVAGGGMESSTIPFHSWSTLAFALFPTFEGPFPVPTSRTDYFGGSAGTVWNQGVEIAPPSSPVAPPFILGPYRTFRPGHATTMTWGASPSVPAPEWQDRGLPAGTESIDGTYRATWSYLCPVCRQGDELSFSVPYSGDDDPTHTESQTGFGFGVLSGPATFPTDKVTFYRNGTLTQISATSGQDFPLLPGKASYEIDWAATIPAVWTSLGTAVDSDWRFTSGPGPASRLPSYELCAPDPARRCSQVPLVFASYDFGADLQGQVPAAGTGTFTVTGYHEAGDSAPPVTQAAVQVSFDDGRTWSAAGVTSLGGGAFRASYPQPGPSAGGGFASVRVTLTDAAGDSLRQTIIRAYALAAAPAGN